jgi:hypothetical protein
MMDGEVLYDGTSGDPTVVWYDPGGTSGWAVISVHPDALTDPGVRILDNIEHMAYGEFTGSEFDQVDAMLDLADSWPGAAIGTEHFILQQFRKDEELLSLVRLNAAFRYEMVRHGRTRRVHRQNAQLAMTTVTDDRLRAWGFWGRTAGLPHARDAIRHNITFLKRLKTQPKLRAEVFPNL